MKPKKLFLAGLLSLGLAVAASAQLAATPPTPGFYTASGECLLTDGSVTLRDATRQMTFHYDLGGNLMMVDMLSLIGGTSPVGGFVWAGKSYYSTPAGMVLDPLSTLFAIESSGATPQNAIGYYYDHNTQRWFSFQETQCAANRSALLSQNLAEFHATMVARFEVDLLTEFDSIRQVYGYALSAFN